MGSVADGFRIVDPDSVLFGLDGRGRLNVLAMISARIWERTGLGAQALYRAFEEDVREGGGGAVNGAALAVARLDGVDAVTWRVARLTEPVAFGAAGAGEADIVFAVVGPLRASSALPKIVRCFDLLTRDAEALAALRAATTANWFCAELTWALERTTTRRSAMLS